LNLLDSHDTARFLTVLQGQKDLLKLAVLFIMTYPGAPCVYYGDEVGLEGGRDPDCRRSFPWDEKQWDGDLRLFYQKCIQMRKSHPALRTGEFNTLYAQGEVMAYQRILGEDEVVVVINRSAATVHLSLEISGALAKNISLKNILDGSQAQVSLGVINDLTLAPKSGVALVKE
jgi:cyclomaltodextrinase / maltogenic alpha-amylase / neopullulanase